MENKLKKGSFYNFIWIKNVAITFLYVIILLKAHINYVSVWRVAGLKALKLWHPLGDSVLYRSCFMFSYLWSVLCPTHQSVQHKLNKTLRSTECAGRESGTNSHKKLLDGGWLWWRRAAFCGCLSSRSSWIAFISGMIVLINWTTN